MTRTAVILKETSNALVDAKRFLKQQGYIYTAMNETNRDNISYDVVFASGFTEQHLGKLIISSKVFTVPNDKYFMLGDNRNLSMDSRYIGTIHEKNITAKIHYIVFNYQEVWDYFFGNLEELRLLININKA